MARAPLFLFFMLAALWALSVTAARKCLGFRDKDLESEESLQLLYDKWVLRQRSPRNASDERFARFKKNVKFIDSVNKKNLTYGHGLNKFADLSNEEFGAMYLKPKNMREEIEKLKSLGVVVKSQGLVKDQGDCGMYRCCRGHPRYQNRNLLSLSAQQSLDCNPQGYNSDSGVEISVIFRYIIDTRGLITQYRYPYDGLKGPCLFPGTIIRFND